MHPGPGTTCLSFVRKACEPKVSLDVSLIAALRRIPVRPFISGTPYSKHGLDTMLYFMYYDNIICKVPKGIHFIYIVITIPFISLLIAVYVLSHRSRLACVLSFTC